jgi:hypothetical protein
MLAIDKLSLAIPVEYFEYGRSFTIFTNFANIFSLPHSSCLMMFSRSEGDIALRSEEANYSNLLIEICACLKTGCVRKTTEVYVS